MSELAETLFLKDLSETETAILALEVVGINPSAELNLKSLVMARYIQGLMEDDHTSFLPILLAGSEAEIARGDIRMGLDMIIALDETAEKRLAAQALLDTLPIQPY